MVQTELTDSTTAVTELPDSVEEAVQGECLKGLVITDPAEGRYGAADAAPQQAAYNPLSWVYLALAILFCATGLKFKGNARYLGALAADLTDTRARQNAFDETVRESSLLMLLNVVWTVCAGILLWTALLLLPKLPLPALSPVTDSPLAGVGICCGAAAIYLMSLYLAYWVTGNVFGDARQTKSWIKGAAASTAFEAFLLFPIALLALLYPRWGGELLLCAAVVFAVGKLMFLYKGFRIFFNGLSSLLLFLYYLCSLEIVPLVLTFGAAHAACSGWL